MPRIDIVEYKYKIGDLVKFRLYDGNAKTREEGVGVVIKKTVAQHLWRSEAEKKALHDRHSILVYEVVCEGTTYTITEDEIWMLVSSKPD